LVVLLKLACSGKDRTPFKELAHDLSLSASEVHAAVRRAELAGLLDAERRVPNRAALLEFLVHGVRYAFSPDRGATTRGMPTAHAARPLSGMLAPSEEPPPVWPDPEGKVRGEGFAPLHRCALPASKRDPALYELLALTDALRGGRARERKLAADELRKRLAA
jgi:DNA-binding Lrp family transcriptional regulator